VDCDELRTIPLSMGPILDHYNEVELSWIILWLYIWNLLEVAIMILLERWDVICLVRSYHYVITSCHMFSHSSHVQQQFSCGGMSVAVTMETKHEVFSLLNLFVTGSAKKGPYSLFDSMYLATRNFHCD